MLRSGMARLGSTFSIVLLLISCGYFKKDPEKSQPASSLADRLRAKEAGWLADLKAQSDATTGWPSATDCDGTLWAGLAKAAGLTTVKLELAEPTPGGIVRSPSSPCTPSSRDTILGYGYGRFVEGDLGAYQRLADYGEAHQWDMSADTTLSYIDPVGQGIIARAIDGLSGGTDKRGYGGIPLACAPPLVKDYEQHLQVVEALLGGEVADKLEARPALNAKPRDIPAGCAETLKELATDSPKDGLFAAANGVYSGAMEPALTLLLSDDYSCPSYVRGAPTYCLVHKLFAARVILKRYPQ